MPAQLFPDLPQGFVVDPGHPVAGPSGNLATDAARFIGTAGVNALAGTTHAVAPMIEASDKATNILRAARGAPPLDAPDTSLPSLRNQGFNTLGATEYAPQTWGGRRGMDALTAAMLGGVTGGGLRMIPGAALGGATGGEAAELAPNHPMTAALLGSIPGMALGNFAANAPLRPGGGTPTPDAPLANAAVNTYGIPLASGQVTTNPFTRFLYSQGGRLPLSGAQPFAEGQQGAFNRAVSGTFGENADRITPEVLQGARDRIGGVFNGVAARTSIPMSNDFLDGLQDIVNRARGSVSADSVPAIERQTLNVIDTAANNGGNIGGRAYIDLTAKGGPIDQMVQSGDPGIRNAGRDLRTLVDNHLAQAATPEDLAALQQARAQWKALRTVEPLTLRADTVGGPSPSTGDISPAALRGGVNRSYDRAATADLGDVPLNDLAKIGQKYLKEPNDSGTASRELANHAIQGAGGLGLAMMGHEAGLPALHSAMGAAATLGANRLAQSIMRSPYLANRTIGAMMNPNGFQFQQPSLLARSLIAPALSQDAYPPPALTSAPARAATQ